MSDRPPLPGDLDTMIADDHLVVERRFQHLEAGRGDRRTIVDQLNFELALHATAEERVAYPAFEEAGLEVARDEAVDEHGRMKELLVVLDREAPGAERFEAALAELVVAVRHHAREEEEVHLPVLRARLGSARMGELGRELRAAKRRAPTHAHPGGPSGATGHQLLDPGAALLDRLRDRASGRDQRLATDATGLLHREAQQLADRFAAARPLPLEVLTPDEARAQPTPFDAVRELAEEQRAPSVATGVAETEIVIPGPGGDLSLIVFHPDVPSEEPLPLVVWLHGGGWVLFGTSDYGPSCRALAAATPAIVVSPEYRLAPEHPFPAAHDDVLAAWRWVRDHAVELGADPGALAIGGESVGGAMAVSTCLQLLSASEPLPVAQVCAYPLVTVRPFGESFRDSADARPLNRPLASWMVSHALDGRPDAATDPRVDLLATPTPLLGELPPTLVINAARDPLRSQGGAFAELLRAAGTDVEHRLFAGVAHEFFGAGAVLPEAREAQALAVAHLAARFRGVAGATAADDGRRTR